MTNRWGLAGKNQITSTEFRTKSSISLSVSPTLNQYPNVKWPSGQSDKLGGGWSWPYSIFLLLTSLAITRVSYFLLGKEGRERERREREREKEREKERKVTAWNCTFLKEAKVWFGPQKNENGKINVSCKWEGKCLYRNESSTNEMHFVLFFVFCLITGCLSVAPCWTCFPRL